MSQKYYFRDAYQIFLLIAMSIHVFTRKTLCNRYAGKETQETNSVSMQKYK